MNVVSVNSADTLPIIYERGLFGMYHDWCESFSTYPRSYDLLHADNLFSNIKNRYFISHSSPVKSLRNICIISCLANVNRSCRCSLKAVVAEIDRILRPEGKLIVRDTVEIINEMESMVKSMQWEVRMTYSKDKVGFLCVQKSMWRPKELETLEYAIG